MRTKVISLAVVVMSLIMSTGIAAQDISTNDPIATSIRMHKLQAKKESLQKEIKNQDSKRNQQISGVSARTLEVMNDKQDSLCLALRSQLVDVILEIKELSPKIDSPQLINQYHNLVHRQDSVASVQPTQSANPVKQNQQNQSKK